MALRRVVVADQQRTDAIDLNRTNDFALDNLARVLGRSLLAAPGAVYRGGKVKQTGPASKNVVVEPLFGINAAGQILLLETDATLAVPNNTSGNPRIDLVSVGYSETDDPAELRKFWDTGAQDTFDQNTVTKKNAQALPALTVGTPAGSPVAPATPAGHIALARVAVADGFASIVDADITRLDVSSPLVAVTWAGDGLSHDLPYTLPAPVLRLGTPAGGLTLLYAQVHVESESGVGIDIEPGSIHRPLSLAIEEVGGAVVCRATARIAHGGELTMHVAGAVAGPRNPAATYQLKFESIGTDGEPWGVFTSLFRLSSEHATGVPTTNLFAAVTL